MDDPCLRTRTQLPLSDHASAVGAVIVDKDGNEVARGWSREDDPHVHAEESALSKGAPDDPRLNGATIYSTLEPCSERKSRPVACTQLIIKFPHTPSRHSVA
jgi:pyrimidine deaminase RibD-like protein